MKQTDNQPAEKTRFREVSPALEFLCWAIVALVPLLRWINGPAVTDDQFVIQVAFASIAVAGAIGLRVYHLRRR